MPHFLIAVYDNEKKQTFVNMGVVKIHRINAMKFIVEIAIER